MLRRVKKTNGAWVTVRGGMVFGYVWDRMKVGQKVDLDNSDANGISTSAPIRNPLRPILGQSGGKANISATANAMNHVTQGGRDHHKGFEHLGRLFEQRGLVVQNDLVLNEGGDGAIPDMFKHTGSTLGNTKRTADVTTINVNER
jgi:hypothetical protein